MVYQNDKVVAMSLASSDAASPAEDIYSTGEQVIGRWVDGKPLYRYTHIRTEVSTFTGWLKLFDATSLRVDKVIRFYGSYKSNNDKVTKPLCDRETTVRYWVKEGTVSVYYGTEWPIAEIILCMEYTKTTDSPSTSNLSFSLPSAVEVSGSSAQIM